MRLLLGMSMMIALSSMAAAAEPQTASVRGCLRWSDIETLTRISPDSVLAKTRRRGDYVIKFRGTCDFQRSPTNYFIVRLHDRMECVSSLGAIDVHEGGACFIESITRLNEASGK